MAGPLILFSSCKKEALSSTIKTEKTPPVEISPGLYLIDFDGVRADGGFCYKIGYDLDGGDSNAEPTKSKMRIFENGIELFPPHSVHDDIRNYGGGRFSHWGSTLYFSTSDNTNPITNGKQYTCTLDGMAYPKTDTVVTHAVNPQPGKVDQ
ncbi:hypothetical protein MuYL_2865 [Mucilaginibacter xinganensis]|uniref:Uncharacterized protein n=2 Tax=Mucilaginibacter xinganensis TaxID=1234841 RepID=A0A223NY18_9SPHI|nr:hypothetical protein MuYL_2865 [Mucilaginibacter xinganensis]